jgi:hypothetical protein
MTINEKQRKAIKFLTSVLISALLFWFTETIADINRPARVSSRKVDAISIISGSKNILINDQERIDTFLKQLKYKFVVPSYNKEAPLNGDYYVLAFFKNNKVVGIFAYNIEKRLLHPSGKPLSADLNNILESFIRENYKLDI